MLDPVDLGIFALDCRHANNVESHAQVGKVLALLQELSRGANEPLLFPKVHAGGSTPVEITGARAYLGDDEDFPLAGNHIELAETAPEVTLENFETLGAQEGSSDLLGPLADFLPVSPVPGGAS